MCNVGGTGWPFGPSINWDDLGVLTEFKGFGVMSVTRYISLCV